MFFASDNASPVPPEVMAALARANEGFAMPYGNDQITARVQDQIRRVFQAPDAAVYLVATGTAANSLALALNCPPWGAVFCHRNAHIAEDECGAPEFFTGGAKLALVEGAHGHMTPDTLAEVIDRTGQSLHNVQRGMLSITNVTEAGTVYTPAEIADLAAVAKAAQPALPSGRCTLCQCTGRDQRQPRRNDMAGGHRHPVLRRHEKRPAGRRSGGDLQPRKSVGV